MYDGGRPWDVPGGRGTPEQERVDNEAVGKHMVMLPEPPENVTQLPSAAFGIDVGGVVTSGTAPSIAVLGEDVMVSVQGLVGPIVRTMLAVLDDKQLYSRSVIVDGDGIAAPRLFSLRGALWVVGSAPSQDGRRASPVVARLEGARVVQRDIITAPRQESHWMPAIIGTGASEKVRFVYTIDPLVVLDYSLDGRGPGVLQPSLAEVPAVMGSVRGGSQLVPWGAGFISLVRQVHRDQRLNAIRHVHRFAKFTADLSVVTLGRKCFSFTGDVTERCGGAIVRTAGGKRSLLVAFGVGASRSMLASVTSEVVDEYLLS